MIKRATLLCVSLCLVLFTACSDDDSMTADQNNDGTSNNDGGNNDDDGSNTSGTGSADVSFSGDLNETLGDYATWEITEDQLLRIRVGDQFSDNIVMNYSLDSDDIQDFEANTYQAVNATGTGFGADTMAFQYNGDSTYYPDSGTITITSIDGNTIEGELNLSMSPVNSDTSTDVTGSFSAEPL